MKHVLRLSALLLCLALLLTLSACKGTLERIFDLFSPGYSEEDNLAEAELYRARPAPAVETQYRDSFRNQLTVNEKAIYDAIAAAAPGEEISVSFPDPHFLPCPVGGEPSETDKNALSANIQTETLNAQIALWLDDPAFYWSAIGFSGGEFFYTKERTEHGNFFVTDFRFSVSREDHFADVTQADVDALYALAREINIRGENVTEKVRNINMILCRKTVYNEESLYAHEALGVFQDGKAVCEGYARAFQILCEVNGVESVCVIGDGVTKEGTEGHMWNYVKADDGKWYCIDVTWNDVHGQHEHYTENYFLCGENTEILGETFQSSHLPFGQLIEGTREFVYPSPESEGID